MQIPFVGGAYEGRSKSNNAQQSINLFPVIDNQEAKVIISMLGTPGLTQFSATTAEYNIRGMHVMGSYLYVVLGVAVYQISSTGVAVYFGALNVGTGHVGMADNGSQLLIVDGSANGHLITGGSLVNIVSAGFPSASDCVFMDGFFIVTVTGSDNIQTSAFNDGTTWDALDVAVAEAAPDNLVGIATTKKNIWLLGVTSTEVYYNSGNADFTFARVPGAVLDVGCGAVGSIIELDDRVYWLSDDKTIARSNGYGFEIVSTPGINYQFSTYTTVSNARAFSYTVEGESFYSICFPTHNKTWVYSVTSGYWHEWQSLNALGVAGMFRGVDCAMFNNVPIVGDSSSGLLYSLSMNVYTDAGLNIRRIRRTQIIDKDSLNIIHSKVEINFQSGVGLNVDEGVAGYDPQAVLKWSDDDGNTWSSGKSISLGKYQEYKKRQIWRRLGRSRNRIYELTIESPVKVVILKGDGELIACKS